MTPSSAVRSFAITLAIAITIIGPGASGFTIDRTKNTPTTQAIDVSVDKTIELQVKNDLRKYNNEQTNKDENSNKTTTNNNSNNANTYETTQKTLEVKTDKFSPTAQATSERSTTAFARMPRISSDTIEVIDSKADNASVTAKATTVRSTTAFVKIPTISSDTVEVFDSIEDTTFYNQSEKIKYTTETSVKHSESILETSEKPMEDKPVTTTTKISEIQFPFKSSTIMNQIVTGMGETEEYSTRKTIARSLESIETTTPMHITTEMTATTTKNATENLSLNPSQSIGITSSDTTLTTTDLSDFLSNDEVKESESKKLSNTNTNQSTTENTNTKTTDPYLEKYTKYTTIIRKRIPSSEETTVTTTAKEDAMKAETSNTVVNFEKAFNITPIPSLEKLRSELLSNINQTAVRSKLASQGTDLTTPTIELQSPTLDIFESTVAKKLGSVQTKRAGYLDNTEKATTSLIASMMSIESTTLSEVNKDIETVKVATVDYSESVETKSSVTKKVSGSESLSQLAEDEMQEELLKEEALNNHQENSNRYHEDTGNEVKPISDESGSDAPTPNAANADDFLSVQPIERSKTTLYTLSPNYKPMKKIDVQPAKPFVRDPDDNSWRNESISSLGIVFKPKNSTISFKEVLKNKTQIELNNLIERAKNNVPDLRVRLEKIAEVRKKKKKMNKDGEVVYTDYEEGTSGESSGTPKQLLSSIPSSGEVSTLIPPLSPHTDSDVTTPLTNLSNMNESVQENTTTIVQSLFSSLGLNQHTTQKPGKLFNAAEYYDTTDEYDADYVTLSRLDLKRFTVPPPRTTDSIATLMTAPIEPHFPERKPTVQYFPPRQSQKVIVNTADRDFEKKVNLFTYKEPASVEPRPPYVTVPPLPIATQKPQSEMRSPPPPVRPSRPDVRTTVRPTDFTIYTPAGFNKNFYMTNAPHHTDPQDVVMDNKGQVDRGSYVIKHYKDFLNAAVLKGDDEERNPDFIPYHTTEPPREVTYSTESDRSTYRSVDDEEEYDDVRFRKEVLTRFVDNFNQNSDRFKVDFPILYNNSVVHRAGGGAPAASRAYIKRLYHDAVATRATGLVKKPCEPNCELTVELSPAYELHYYVPGQEEREEPEPRTAPALSLPPYRYGL